MLNSVRHLLFGTLRRQLVVGFAIVLAVIMSVFIWDMTLRHQKMVIDQQTMLASALARSLATSSATWIASKDISGLQEIIDAQGSYPDLVFAMLTNESGFVLAHSDKTKVGQNVLDMPSSAEFSMISRSSKLVDIAMPAMLSGRHVGWARVGIDQKAAGARLSAITRNGVYYSMTAIIVGSLLAWLMGAAFTRRLRVIQKTIDAVKSGRSESRIHLGGNDEASLLAGEFNSMLDTLVKREESLQQSESNLREINSSLEKSEHVLRMAQKVAHTGSWNLDLNKDELLWSDETYSIFGMEPGTPMTLEQFAECIHPDDQEGVLSAWSAALAGSEYSIEHRIVVDGRLKWVHERAELRFDSAGNAVSGIGTVQDITERKQIEALLKENQERYMAMFINSPDAYLIMEISDGTITDCNKAAEAMLGGDRSQILGRTPDQVSPEFQPDGRPSREAAAERIAESLQSGQHSFEWMHRRLDGTDFWAHVKLSVLIMDGRQVMLVAWRDITENKRIESEIRESQERLDLAIRSADMGVWSWDIDRNIRIFDDKVCHFLGIEPDSFKGTAEEFFAAVHPEDRDQLTAVMIRTIEEDVLYAPEYRAIWPDGSIHHISARAKLIRDDKGKPVQLNGILWDNTVRKQAEERMALLAVIVESSEDAIISETLEGTITSWNKGAEKLFGYTEQEALGQSVSMLFPQRQLDEEKNILSRVARGEALPQYESHRVCKNGRVISAAITISPVFDDKGRVVAASKIIRDISKLKESEERFRTTINLTGTGFVVIDTQGCVEDANETYLRMTQFETLDEIRGRSVIEWTAPESMESNAAAVARAARDGAITDFETVYLRRDGSRITIFINVVLEQSAQGARLVTLCRDITERKMAEHKLRDTLDETSRLNRLMQGRETSIVELKRRINTLCKEAGQEDPYPAVEKQDINLPSTGYFQGETTPELEELIDIGLWQRILDDFCDALDVSSAIVDLKGKILVSARWRRICTDFHRVGKESLCNCIDSDTLLATEMGRNKKYAIYTCRNGMTDAASPIFLNGRHVANVFVGQFLVKPPDRAMFAGQATKFGYDVTEYLKALDEVPVLDEHRVQAALNFMSSYAETVAMMALDASRRQEIAQLLRTQQLNLLSLAEDAEHARDAAERASRAKSEFLANMSHEIRTPLNGVIGIAHLMTYTPLSSKQEEYVRKIQSSSKALLGILNDILDYSKIEAGHLELESTFFCLDDVLSMVSDLFSIRVEEQGLEMFFEVAPDVPHCFMGDSLRLGQVLINLVGNAIKFTHQGEIHIRVRQLERLADTALLEISVKDTGIGIPEEIQKTLFTPFTQADSSTTRRYGGTGLGLTICRKIVELLGGEIAIVSSKGAGSTFTFTARMQVSIDTPIIRDPSNLRGMRTLIADDADTSRLILRQILESWSFAVTTVTNGSEALDAVSNAAQAGEPYELLLLDWKMPEMDGLDVALTVKQAASSGTLPDIPLIIMVTAFGREQLMAAANHVRIDGALNKPVIPSELFDLIMNVQNEKSGKKLLLPQGSRPGKGSGQLLKGLRVLLVEDQKVNQMVASELLESMGVLVSIANNGIEAVEMSASEDYDVVLMDLQMPGMDGFEATRKIRATERGSHLPILAMTAAAMVQDRDACLKAGMNDHISKPIEPDDLLKTLLKWTETPENTYSCSEPGKAIDTGRPFKLQGFDLDDAVNRFAGNWSALRKALRLFVEDYADSSMKLDELLASGNLEDALRLVHSLKSITGNLSAEELYKAVVSLEAELMSGGAVNSAFFRERIRIAVETIQNSDSVYFKESGTAAYDIDQIRDDLSTMVKTMEEHVIVPSEFMIRLRGMLANCQVAHLFHKLEHQIDHLDYEEGLATINMIAECLGINLNV